MLKTALLLAAFSVFLVALLPIGAVASCGQMENFAEASSSDARIHDLAKLHISSEDLNDPYRVMWKELFAAKYSEFETELLRAGKSTNTFLLSLKLEIMKMRNQNQHQKDVEVDKTKNFSEAIKETKIFFPKAHTYQLPGRISSQSLANNNHMAFVGWLSNDGGYLKVIDINDGSVILENTYPVAITKVQFSPSGRWLLIANKFGSEVTLYDLQKKQQTVFNLATIGLNQIAFDPNEKLVAFSDAASEIHVVDLRKKKITWAHDLKIITNQKPNIPAWGSPQGLAITDDGLSISYEILGQRYVKRIHHQQGETSVTIAGSADTATTYDKRYVVSKNSIIPILKNVTTGMELEIPNMEGLEVVVSADHQVVVAESIKNSEIRAFSLKTGKQINTFPTSQEFQRLRVSGDGRFILNFSKDWVRINDLITSHTHTHNIQASAATINHAGTHVAIKTDKPSEIVILSLFNSAEAVK